MNDITQLTFTLAQPLFAAPVLKNCATGAFIIMYECNNDTAGVEMILRGMQRP